MGEAVHLARRFTGALLPVGPKPVDAAWAEDRLLPRELDLWQRMSAADRRHAVGVARRVEESLGSDGGRAILAAALLHDVGKVVSGIGTYRRVVATLMVRSAGRSRAAAWGDHRRGFVGRVGLYADHPRLGAELLTAAGSDPLTVAWAREHHLPEERWSVDAAVGFALKAADDD